MGLLSRIFSKKDLETLESTRKQFEALLKKTTSKFISLVGITGKVKGMDIITVADPEAGFEKNEVRRYHAKLAESHIRFTNLGLMPPDDERKLRMVMYSYTGDTEFFVVPIPGNDEFVIITLTTRQGITKIMKIVDQIGITLNQIRSSRENERENPAEGTE